MQPIRLGLVGYGKIAQDQHVPAINANPGFRLVAVATQGKPCAGVENFHSLSELLENGPEVDAIAIQWRHFGSAGVAAWRGGSVVETFTRCERDVPVPGAMTSRAVSTESGFTLAMKSRT